MPNDDPTEAGVLALIDAYGDLRARYYWVGFPSNAEDDALYEPELTASRAALIAAYRALLERAERAEAERDEWKLVARGF